MLETYIDILPKVWSNKNFDLKWFINSWKGSYFALLSFVSEFKFHFASLMAVMNMLTSWTEFVNLSEHGTILALNQYFGLGFVKSNV